MALIHGHGLLSTLDAIGNTQNYKIQVTREGVVYTVRRRYSDFLALDKNVQQAHALFHFSVVHLPSTLTSISTRFGQLRNDPMVENDSLAKLPPKKWYTPTSP